MRATCIFVADPLEFSKEPRVAPQKLSYDILKDYFEK